jgi:hypothetical protein
MLRLSRRQILTVEVKGALVPAKSCLRWKGKTGRGISLGIAFVGDVSHTRIMRSFDPSQALRAR